MLYRTRLVYQLTVAAQFPVLTGFQHDLLSTSSIAQASTWNVVILLGEAFNGAILFGPKAFNGAIQNIVIWLNVSIHEIEKVTVCAGFWTSDHKSIYLATDSPSTDNLVVCSPWQVTYKIYPVPD